MEILKSKIAPSPVGMRYLLVVEVDLGFFFAFHLRDGLTHMPPTLRYRPVSKLLNSDHLRVLGVLIGNNVTVILVGCQLFNNTYARIYTVITSMPCTIKNHFIIYVKILRNVFNNPLFIFEIRLM